MARWLLCAALLLGSATTTWAQPNRDLSEATASYRAAEKAMTDGRFEEAARSYGSAYEISKDPVLFFKMGSALDKAGKCQVAITYYRRYLREAKPAANYQKLTAERIAACEAKTGARPAEPTGPAEIPDVPDEAPAPGATGAATTGPAKPPVETAAPEASPAEAPEPDAPEATPAEPPAAPIDDGYQAPSGRRTGAWFSVAAGLAFVTVGSVFALSAETTEDDIADLYVIRAGGRALAYDGATRDRYDDLVARGDRYQTLAWVSFGLAGAAALTATYLLVTAPDESPSAPRTALRPMLGPGGAGVSAAWRW